MKKKYVNCWFQGNFGLCLPLYSTAHRIRLELFDWFLSGRPDSRLNNRVVFIQRGNRRLERIKRM